MASGGNAFAPILMNLTVHRFEWFQTAAFIFGCIFLLSVVGCTERRDPLVTFLEDSWDSYKSIYIKPEGCVFDEHRGEVTSEGQSYALLRSAWMKDPETFERVYLWTEANLKRGDGLYAWQWNPATASVQDWNTATDADQDIAFALLIAGRIFQKPEYTRRARQMVRAVRTATGISVGEVWFPSAGNWAVAERIVNLSYFTPYAYPYFQAIDPDGRWPEAIETGYALINQALALPEVRLIPDFLVVDSEGTVLPLPVSSPLSRDFSFDAMRIPWRVALHCRLHGRTRACTDPPLVDTLADLLTRDGKIFTRYRTDGTPIQSGESLSFYGSLLPALHERYPHLATSLLDHQLSPRSLESVTRLTDRYYDLNWIWFGIALTTGWITDHTPPPQTIPL